MSGLFWLSDEQIERLRSFFPRRHGKPRVDDRRVLSGIMLVNRNATYLKAHRTASNLRVKRGISTA